MERPTALRRAERRARFDAAARTAAARAEIVGRLLRRCGVAVTARAGGALAWLASPAVVAFALIVAATACAVAGVYLLAGLPWSLIAAAVILFALATILLRGIANG